MEKSNCVCPACFSGGVRVAKPLQNGPHPLEYSLLSPLPTGNAEKDLGYPLWPSILFNFRSNPGKTVLGSSLQIHRRLWICPWHRAIRWQNLVSNTSYQYVYVADFLPNKNQFKTLKRLLLKMWIYTHCSKEKDTIQLLGYALIFLLSWYNGVSDAFSMRLKNQTCHFITEIKPHVLDVKGRN